ncbi:hypothetical protein [Bifidobacterium mongoliense]|uniref:hypothetical protein n=1 Tax=Bifidobacterium mongoliense TaxID=518643 RepID=UPI0030EE738C
MSQPSRRTCDLVDARDECRCVICGQSLEQALSASRHHRRMRSHPFPGLHETSNVIDVCGSGSTGCHARIHGNPGFAYSQGWLVHSWDDHPEDIPVNTYQHGWVLLDNDGHWKPYEPTKESK